MIPSAFAMDGWRLLGARAGVARYILSLLREWDRGVAPFERLHLCSPTPLPDRWTDTSPIRNEVLRGSSVRVIWESTSLWKAARRDGLLFCPSERIPVRRPCPVVVTIFAILPYSSMLSGMEWRFWHAAFHERLYRHSARHADLIITETEHARHDISATYGVSEDRIRVVPLAPSVHFRRVNDAARIANARRRLTGGDGPFVLFVGTFSERRNIPLLIEAFGDVRRHARLPHRLVLVGRNVAGYDVEGLAAAAGVAGAVVHPQSVGDEDLVLLYNAAAVTVHSAANAPGLPVLESLATGTPVVAVRSDPIEEVAGDAVVLVDYPTREALAAGLESVLADEASRLRWVARAEAVSTRYTWERTAADTLALLAEVAGH